MVSECALEEVHQMVCRQIDILLLVRITTVFVRSDIR